ncbi:MAG: hypothetical protein WDW36_010315 [Sanguina aurantia]
MLSRKKAAKRFSLLLLEEGEEYVQDFVVTCRWPTGVSGNWSNLPSLAGRLRLCTHSLFFEPDDVRVPIVRLPFASTTHLGKGTLSVTASSSSRTRAEASKLTAPALSSPEAVLSVVASALVKMRANLEEVPYTFQSEGGPLGVGLLAALRHAGRVRGARSGAVGGVAAAQAIVRRREDAACFDSSRLLDFSERVLFECAAVQLSPLVKERGHLLITSHRVYFQPLHNVAGDVPVRSQPLSLVAAVARRRSCLRPIGLELFFLDRNAAACAAKAAVSTARSTPSATADGSSGSHKAVDESAAGGIAGPCWDAPSAFFTFRSEDEREQAAAILTSCPELGRSVPVLQPSDTTSSQSPGSSPSDNATSSHAMMTRGMLLEAQGAWLPRVTAAWQHARISNFDYLLYLNLAAGRSFNDLAQWPVFPWVIANYVTAELNLHDPANFRDLSRPVGALNPGRLSEFRKRFREMPADAMDGGWEGAGGVTPFLYGTHYSTPGYVMYWLLRAAPSHMLRLQNGRFDAPDRMFNSIQESWASVNTSSTDVKELTPEFFLPNAAFLTNKLRLPLGQRQNGVAVEDVSLPPWACSPEDFLAKHRLCLESPHVSAHLHHWIDLIFGAKQRGPAAEAADNLFYYLTYEGAVDISRVSDPMELKALETQINEFGQTPRQLCQTFRTSAPPPPQQPPTRDSKTSVQHHRPPFILSASIPFVTPPVTAARGNRSSSSGALSDATASPGQDTPSALPTAAADSDAGYQALALALLHTILEAASVDSTHLRIQDPAGHGESHTTALRDPSAEPHGLPSHSASFQDPGARRTSSSGSPPPPPPPPPPPALSSSTPQAGDIPCSASHQGRPAQEPAHQDPAIQGPDGGMLSSSSLPQPAAGHRASPAPLTQRACASTGGDLAGLGSRVGSGISSFLKLGRYRQQAQPLAGKDPPAPAGEAAPAPAGEAAPGTGVGVSSASSSPGADPGVSGVRPDAATMHDALPLHACSLPVLGVSSSPPVRGQTLWSGMPGARQPDLTGSGSSADMPASARAPSAGAAAAAAAAAAGAAAAAATPAAAAASQPAENSTASAATSAALQPAALTPTPPNTSPHPRLQPDASVHATSTNPPAAAVNADTAPLALLQGASVSAAASDTPPSHPSTWGALPFSSLTRTSSVQLHGHAVNAVLLLPAHPHTQSQLRTQGLPSTHRFDAQPLDHVRGPAAAAAAAAGHGVSVPGRDALQGHVCCVGDGGMLRVLRLADLAVVRAAQLGGDLLCMAAVAPSPSSPSAAPAGAGHGGLPLLLIGSHSCKLHAYNCASGTLLGSFPAHDDAVCCVGVPSWGSSGDLSQDARPDTRSRFLREHTRWCGTHWRWSRAGSAAWPAPGIQPPMCTHTPPMRTPPPTPPGPLPHSPRTHMLASRQVPQRCVTGSWDCSVKVWALAEGRAPWDTRLSLPEQELRGSESGVWAMALGGQPGCVVTGTEEGVVAQWDCRSGGRAWQASVCDDYIGGLAVTPDGLCVVSAAADGYLSLLDVRKAGQVTARVACGCPLRSLVLDGGTALAGDESGVLHSWDLGSATGSPWQLPAQRNSFPTAPPSREVKSLMHPSTSATASTPHPRGSIPQTADASGSVYRRLQWQDKQSGPLLSLSAAVVGSGGQFAVVVGQEEGSLSLLASVL